MAEKDEEKREQGLEIDVIHVYLPAVILQVCRFLFIYSSRSTGYGNVLAGGYTATAARLLLLSATAATAAAAAAAAATTTTTTTTTTTIKLKHDCRCGQTDFVQTHTQKRQCK